VEAISYLSNQVGKNKRLLIDFETLQSKRNVGKSFEEVEDILALELNKFEDRRQYLGVRKELI
jgi:hypothetical protein